MGGTTALRTLRLSATSGSRTIFSMIATVDGANSAGSSKRLYTYYRNQNKTIDQFYNEVYGLSYGKYKNQSHMLMKYQ
jgi:hypothetical protein